MKSNRRWQNSVLRTAATLKIALPWEKTTLRASQKSLNDATPTRGRASNA